MPIYDFDGTARNEIGKIYDFDGVIKSEIIKIYDFDGTSRSEVWNGATPELLIFDKGVTYFPLTLISYYDTLTYSGDQLIVHTWTSDGILVVFALGAKNIDNPNGYKTLHITYSTEIATPDIYFNCAYDYMDTTYAFPADMGGTVSVTNSAPVVKFSVHYGANGGQTVDPGLRITKIWLTP